jgi:hypothetical protein
VTEETPPGHLGDGRDVVGAAVTRGLTDGVVPIIRLARQTVLEHHRDATTSVPNRLMSAHLMRRGVSETRNS